MLTALAIPDYRLQPSDKPLLQFEERASNAPEAIKAFFYPGDNYGLQFVYPHKRATELAKRTRQHVLSTRDELGQNMKTQGTFCEQPGRAVASKDRSSWRESVRRARGTQTSWLCPRRNNSQARTSEGSRGARLPSVEVARQTWATPWTSTGNGRTFP